MSLPTTSKTGKERGGGCETAKQSAAASDMLATTTTRCIHQASCYRNTTLSAQVKDVFHQVPAENFRPRRVFVMLKFADQWLLPGSTHQPGGNCSVSVTQRLTPVRVLSAAALPVKPDTRWLPARGSTIPLGSAHPADSHRLNDLSTSQSTCSLRDQSGSEGKCVCAAGFSGSVHVSVFP